MSLDLKTLPLAGEWQSFFDGIAGMTKLMAPTLGKGDTGETGTVAALAEAFHALGTSNEAVSNGVIGRLRWDTTASEIFRSLLIDQEARMDAAKPDEWTLRTPVQIHPMDSYLMRLNGTASPLVSGSTTPGVITLTASSQTTGLLPPMTSDAPFVVVTWVGDADWKESTPSAAVQGGTLASPNNAYTVTIAGVVPAAVFKMRLYRTLRGGTISGPFFYAGEYAVTAGATVSGVFLLKPDSLLRVDIVPPSWLSCLVPAEAATVYALANGQYTTASARYQYQTGHLLSAQNVVLVPANALLGYDNTESTGRFKTVTITGSGATQTPADGLISATSQPTVNIQGHGGALKLRLRVLAAVGGNGTVTISYTYSDAGTGYAATATATGVTATLAATAVGSLAVFTITAGRLIKSVTITSVSGFVSGTGTLAVEGDFARTY